MSLFGKSEKIAVVFDIGSSSVGGAYVSLVPGQKPKIIAAVREEMVFQEDLKFDRLISSLQDALERTGQALSKTHLPFLTKKVFLCSFSSPWYASQTRVASIETEKPFTITEDFLAEAVDKEVGDFISIEAKQLGESVIMEHEAIQVKLNGYETENPIGKKAKSADVAAYVSVIPEKIFLLVKEKIGRIFHAPHLRLHSFPFSAFVVVRDLFHKNSFLFLDVSGEVTDVSLVHGGVLQETASFPYGKNFVFRSLMRKLSLSHTEAVAEFALHQKGDAHEKNSERMEKVLREAGFEWQRGLDSALESFSRVGTVIPPDIFLSIDADASKWFLEQIDSEKIYNTTGGSEKYFHVRPLQSQFFGDLVNFGSGIARDPFLALLAVFAGKNEHRLS